MRTATSQTFEQADGSFVTQFFTKPIFYRATGSDDWQPIDLHLRPVTGTGPNAVMDKANTQLSLRAADSANGFLTSSAGEHSISLVFPSGVTAGRAGTKATISPDGVYADFADFLPGNIGLRVFPTSDGVRTFLILNENPANDTFRFVLAAPGLTATIEPDGAIALSDGSAIVAWLPRPYMVDSSVDELRGGGLYSEAVTQSLATEGRADIVQLTIDPAYLDSAIRKARSSAGVVTKLRRTVVTASHT